MEQHDFDRLARRLGAPTSRRRFGGWLLALGLGAGPGLGLLGSAESAGNRSKNKKKKKKRKNKGKPQVRPDAGCPGPATNFLGFGSGDARFAQTFSPLRSGKLTSARVPIGKGGGSTGDYVLHLAVADDPFGGLPTNTVLATATLANSAVPTGTSTQEFVFDPPPKVASDRIYALILTRPDGSQLATTLTSVSSCPGTAFKSETQSGGFLPIGDSFVFDLAPFQTFVAS